MGCILRDRGVGGGEGEGQRAGETPPLHTAVGCRQRWCAVPKCSLAFGGDCGSASACLDADPEREPETQPAPPVSGRGRAGGRSPGAKDNFVKLHLTKAQTAFKTNLKPMNVHTPRTLQRTAAAPRPIFSCSQQPRPPRRLPGSPVPPAGGSGGVFIFQTC